MVCSGPAPGEGGCGATLEDMGGPRPRARRLVLATAVAAPMLYARWLRPQLLTWGATPEETTGAYPGDKLVPDPDGGATMATTLPAPPERVWPWLVQMGLGRGGWYSWDWLDNDGAPSADRIVAHWQRLEVGQHLDRVPKGLTNWWIVAVLEPDRTLVLQGSYESLTGQGFDPRSGPRPWAWVEGVWGFHLQQAPGAGCSGEPPTGKSSCRAVAWCADRPSQLPVHRGGRGSPARILVAAWSADGLAAPLPDRLRPVTARTSPGYVGHQWTNPGGDGDLASQ